MRGPGGAQQGDNRQQVHRPCAVAELHRTEGNRDAVGEHAVGLLLALLDNIARADAEVRQGLWRREANRGLELGSLTVGIIGYGNMGQSFAKRLSGFGCRVVIYDKYKEIGTLEEVQREADVVSFHVPLTDETHHYLDAGFIEAMAKPFFVVNTARGAVVDTEALVQGMENGKVRGAALDVLETEPPAADSPLWDTPNLLLTPHVAGNLTMAYTRRRNTEMFCEDLKRFATGEPLLHQVDRSRGY